MANTTSQAAHVCQARGGGVAVAAGHDQQGVLWHSLVDPAHVGVRLPQEPLFLVFRLLSLLRLGNTPGSLDAS